MPSRRTTYFFCSLMGMFLPLCHWRCFLLCSLIIELNKLGEFSEFSADCPPVAVHSLLVLLIASFPLLRQRHALCMQFCWIGADACWKLFCRCLVKMCRGQNLFNTRSISLWIPLCGLRGMSPAPVSSTAASPLCVCLFNMQRRSFGESFPTRVNESAAMISWRCRGSVHHGVSPSGSGRTRSEKHPNIAE